MQTILFTDIEGSTRLWEERPEAMTSALARHDEILTTAIGEAGGHVLKTTGDGFIATFDSPGRGAAAALRAQEALGAEVWSATGAIRVRMGLHAGETEHRGNDLFGPTMNRTARIMAAGHGGQVLLSAAVAALLHDDLPAGTMLRDLGSHRLKDLTRPERLYQLVAANLHSEFPALRTLDAHANNLPLQATEFMGRGNELAAVNALLDSPGTRLLTLTGPGGTGKTRLALQVAADRSDLFRDGVFFVDLSGERTPEAAFEAAVRALDLPAARGGDPLETLKVRLNDKQMLLVLDNFEQVMSAALGVSELLQSVADLKVIVTSRESLRVRAEQVFPVPPLTLPERDAPAETIAASEAVRFFTERARAVRPDFVLTAANAAAVAAICLRLDGLPLALELAAARLNVFTPADLQARLEERLDVLGSGARDLPDRQRTLWGAIGWSYELLDSAERDLFEAMSVFSSASLTALEAVAASSLGGTFVLDALSSLVDKSLVQSREDRTTQRFSMLRMVNEYASARLAAAADKELAVREAHARYFASFALRLTERLRGSEQASTLEDLESELGNLRTAWRFWVDRRDVEQLLGLIDGLWALHEARGWYPAAIEFAREVLEVLASSGRSAEFAAEELTLRTGLARAVMAISGYNAEAEAAFTRALELARATGAATQEFSVLRSLASYYNQRTSWDAAVKIGRQLLELGEQARDPAMLAEGHYVVAASTLFSQPQAAIAHLDQAIALWDSKPPTSDRFRLGPNSAILARTASAMMLWDAGKLEQSVSRMNDALRLARSLDHPYTLAYALYHCGFLAVRRSRPADCLEYARELAKVSADHDYKIWATLATLLEGVAIAALGSPTQGLVMTETAVDLYQGLTPPPAFWPFVLMLRAAVHAMAGKPERAVELVEEASAAVASLDVDPPALRVMRADLMRMLPDPDVDAIEAHYLAAIKTGEATGLRLAVLTGWTGLVTLRRKGGRTPDGSEGLAAVYASFADGPGEQEVTTARNVLGDAVSQTDPR